MALAQHQSWVRSNRDQAAFAAGADVRVDLSQPLPVAQAGRLAKVPAVLDATPVVVADSATNAGSPLVALDPGRAAQIALLRPDQSPLPAAALFRKIQPSGTRPGVVLQGQAGVIRFTAALGPARLKLLPASVTITIDDGDGDAYQFPAGTLTADGRPHTLTVRVAAAGSQVVYPLRVTSIIVDYALPSARVAGRGDVPGPLGELRDRAAHCPAGGRAPRPMSCSR